MSSHREAPGISKDPVADNTDTYAFVTPGHTVTIVTNYVPAQAPAGGPNFYEFGDDVLYEIHVDTDGDGRPDVTWRFQFETTVADEETFLYNTGPITSLDSPSWNRRQRYRVTRVDRRRGVVETPVASGVPCPPCNIGPRSTPNYPALAAAAVKTLPDGTKLFAGQRADPFFVDLGSVFDLGTLRPVEALHLIPTANAAGVDSLKAANVHTIALQVPMAQVTRDGSVPSDPMAAGSVIGVWGAASRRKATILGGPSAGVHAGPWVQVSRLGNPLFNEVIVPMAEKDRWNAVGPDGDGEFAKYVAQPELARLLPVLYPGVFPNLAGLHADRADLLAVLLTGIPAGIVPGFQNYTGPTPADMLRLNLAIPPASSPNRLGLVGGDPAGFPNGRRLADDVVTIELRAVAGLTYPLVSPGYVPDGAASIVEDGTYGHPGRTLLGSFPYVGTPYSGYEVPAA
ncbi:MAG TPA: DUF4331 domain-containing protein [Acidimicrobiales bacterium]|nr:DUF4331 domain-containing protein [Acidimicrobiales bacterium]